MEIETQTSSRARERRRTQRVSFERPNQGLDRGGRLPRRHGGEPQRAGDAAAHKRLMTWPRQNLPLCVTFNLPDVETPLQVQAEVVHARKDGQRVSLGLRFMTVPPVIRRMLRTYVATGCGRIKDYAPEPAQLAPHSRGSERLG